jgi:pyruvate/2-oxoglutarate dehydrogenase complex dihydrolipoamide acyltransferase (E2) component
MPTNIIMPQLGESVVEGTVSEWLKRVGDTVNEFESIVRVSTDKVDTEIPSPASGVLLEIYVNSGDTVNAGVLLGIIGAKNEKVVPVATSIPVMASQGSTVAPVKTGNGQAREGYGAHITPVVARMAQEHQLDLSQITGTGNNGRITKKDVEAYLQNLPANPALPPWEQPGSGDLFKPSVEYSMPTPTSKATTPTSVAIPVKESLVTNLPYEVLPITSMRRSIADHMVKSKHISPHVTTVFEVDLSKIVKHREANKAEYERQGINLTYTPYFVLASVVALRQYPVLNARWADEGIQLLKAYHIGIATALDDGLIVPVVKNAQDLNLSGIARQVNELSTRARNKQLRPDEVKDGTFTITNHGISGSLFATPIINQPQVAILGVGAIEKRVKVIDDAIAIRPCVYLSLTFDHRLIDGATADNFVKAIKQLLEIWS